MSETLSYSSEDYIKIIYDLTSSGKRASTSQIARRMSVTPASATGMVQRLATSDPPLVEYQKHHGVVLTAAGERAALEVIRHHRLLETFLHQALGYSWDEVHVEADRLEHVLSEQLAERIAQAIGNPTRDPHGEPIPSRELSVPPESTLRLGDLRPGQTARVQRTGDTTPELLRYLGSIGLVPEAEVTVLEYSDFDGNLRLQVDRQPTPVVLGPRVTGWIYVELI